MKLVNLTQLSLNDASVSTLPQDIGRFRRPFFTFTLLHTLPVGLSVHQISVIFVSTSVFLSVDRMKDLAETVFLLVTWYSGRTSVFDR